MKPLRLLVACAALAAGVGVTGVAAASPAKVKKVQPTMVASYPFNLVAVGQSNGTDTAVIQLRLSDLGFWLKNVDGVYETTTKQAVMAFQKYVGLKRTGSVNEETATALAAAQHKAVGRSDVDLEFDEDIVEVDKERQLAFVVRNGTTVMTLNVSTGNDKPYEEPDANTPNVMLKGVANTPVGKYRTDRARTDGWWHGDMGPIYRPIYFNGGIAFHGSAVVPGYPASHGCVRVSVMAMDQLWKMKVLELGSRVWVY